MSSFGVKSFHRPGTPRTSSYKTGTHMITPDERVSAASMQASPATNHLPVRTQYTPKTARRERERLGVHAREEVRARVGHHAEDHELGEALVVIEADGEPSR